MSLASRRQDRHIYKCCVTNCDFISKGIKVNIFKFPSNIEQKLKWLEALNKTSCKASHSVLVAWLTRVRLSARKILGLGFPMVPASQKIYF